MLIIQPSSQQKGTIIKQEGKQIRQVTSLNAVRRGEGNPQKGGCENPKWAAAVLKTLREPLTRALKKKRKEGKESGKPLRLGSLLASSKPRAP